MLFCTCRSVLEQEVSLVTPIDFQITWSKVKVKLLVFEKNISLKIAKSGTVNVSREQMTPIDVQFTWSKVQIKLLVFVQRMSLDSLA